MKPADRVALLTALIEGAKKELDHAKAEALLVADVVGVKTFTTDWGQVTIGQKSAGPFVAEPAKLLAYVEHTYPSEVVREPIVRPSFVTALIQRVEWSEDLQEFVDTASGDAIPGLAMSQAGDPYVTWPSGEAQKRTKEEAALWFASRSEQILSGMLAVGQGSER